MTKIKIKEGNAKFHLDPHDLKAGDMLYSPDWDTLILIVENDGDFNIVDLSDNEIVSSTGFSCFEEIFNDYTDNYGPFGIVKKAKITLNF